MPNDQRVFVLDQNKVPLMPCHPARARELLRAGKAAVWRRQPLTIILKRRSGGQTQPVQLKLDPGSKTTGIALVGDFKRGNKVLWGAELNHRGLRIKLKLEARRTLRSSRRSRTVRYRPARFLNRTKPAGWLAPSLRHRVLTAGSWVARLRRWVPVTALSTELVRFDLQKMENPEISGTEYQQGTLSGYEVKGYLLQKFGHQCVYCGKQDVPLEVEHIQPRSRGGSDRVSNLTIACVACNQKKGAKPAEVFLKGRPEVLRRVLARAKAPLRDAAAVNAVRWALLNTLKASGLPVETGSGGRTKFNRTRQGLPKTHWTDAACVGVSGARVRVGRLQALSIQCMGRGHRQMCQTDRFGFPKQHRRRVKVSFGFQTGDLVRADVPSGKHAGVYTGRVTIRAVPRFLLGTHDVNPKYLTRLQHADGYAYQPLAARPDHRSTAAAVDSHGPRR